MATSVRKSCQPVRAKADIVAYRSERGISLLGIVIDNIAAVQALLDSEIVNNGLDHRASAHFTNSSCESLDWQAIHGPNLFG